MLVNICKPYRHIHSTPKKSLRKLLLQAVRMRDSLPILYPQLCWIYLLVLATFNDYDFLLIMILSYVYRDSFTSSFPIQMPNISFSCLLDMTRTSSTMLNCSGESGHFWSCSWY